MKLLGALVSCRGWKKPALGIVIDERSPDSSFHHRVRVMWIGEKIPVAASAFSTSKGRITTWIHPKIFDVVGEPDGV